MFNHMFWVYFWIKQKLIFFKKKFKHKFFWIEYKFLLRVDLKRHTFVTLDPKKKLNLGTPHMDAP